MQKRRFKMPFRESPGSSVWTWRDQQTWNRTGNPESREGREEARKKKARKESPQFSFKKSTRLKCSSVAQPVTSAVAIMSSNSLAQAGVCSLGSTGEGDLPGVPPQGKSSVSLGFQGAHSANSGVKRPRGWQMLSWSVGEHRPLFMPR